MHCVVWQCTAATGAADRTGRPPVAAAMAKPKSTAADGKAEETNVKVIVRKRG